MHTDEHICKIQEQYRNRLVQRKPQPALKEQFKRGQYEDFPATDRP